jgi:hypothetical protein
MLPSVGHDQRGGGAAAGGLERGADDRVGDVVGARADGVRDGAAGGVVDGRGAVARVGVGWRGGVDSARAAGAGAAT